MGGDGPVGICPMGICPGTSFNMSSAPPRFSLPVLGNGCFVVYINL